VAAQQKQPINKTIGINKLGTLLSSQTTDTPSTTQTIPFRIAPEQLSKLTRSSGSLQISVSADFRSSQPAPPTRHTTKASHFLGGSEGVSVAIFPHQRRRLRKQYTPTNRTANRLSAVAGSPKILAGARILEAPGAGSRP
ncbi:hypothetical protein, partial [Pseudarthrobacter sp. fls2-241-R2A-127]|uniref:hypothetical protein n=1 Tax=Pseudarthrobacter sp. fls2-241-R2A-127 TaxID=3040303 RepID=UPI002552CFBE